MRTGHALGVLVTGLVVGLAGQAVLGACGTKIFVLTRGTRFERPATRHEPAAIAIYAPPDSGFPRALATLPIVATLERAGYSTTVIGTAAELDAALQRGGVDLLLLDLASTKALDGRSHGAASPAIVPVVFSERRADAAQAVTQFHCAVKSPSHSQSFFEAIDQALAERRAAKGR
jgi:hypothetical protein